jgi:branched-chain amino acid transport system permease protein
VGLLVAELLNGLAVGSIYALVVTGFNLLLLVGGVVQFAYPHFVVLSMYVAWFVFKLSPDNVALAIPAAILASMTLSILTEPLFRPLVRRGASNQTFVMAMAMALILTFLMARVLNHGVPVSFPPSLTGTGSVIQFGLASVSAGQLYTLGVSILAVSGFLLLLARTKLGRSFRVLAQTPMVGRLLGIPVVKTSVASYAVAGFLGGVTAVCLAMALGSANPGLGDTLALKAMAVALFAGLGNLRGGLFGALILGVAESLTVAYLPGDWSNAVSFAMIMVVIMFRPSGLFGAKA